MSISLWVKPDATPGGEQMLFTKSSLDPNLHPGPSAGIRLGMTGSTFFFTGTTAGGQSSFSVTAAVVPQAGVWYHVVGEIDRANASDPALCQRRGIHRHLQHAHDSGGRIHRGRQLAGDGHGQ